MAELTVRQLAARLDDVEERYDAALKELRDLRAEGAPPAVIAEAEADVKKEEAKVKTAEEEIADAKATLKRHGYELDEDSETPAGQGEPEGDPEADADSVPDAKPVQDPPKDTPKPKPDVEPEAELHWSERTIG